MFRSDPRDHGVKLLLSVDEGSYKGKLLEPTVLIDQTMGSQQVIIQDTAPLIPSVSIP